MDLRTFQANTMSAALTEVKQEMGPNAMILHTRSFYKNRWLGLRRREIFEITATRNVRAADRNPRPQPPARPAPVPVKPPAEARRQLLETPVGQNVAMLGFIQELSSLKGMVKELVVHSNRMRCPEIPEELFDFYNQLIQNQVAEELAAGMIKTLQKQIRPEHARQSEFVKLKLAEQIERLLPTAGPIVRTKAVGPHVVALIGPTGVGKTTTIAKLAANLKLREKRRVGLITLDTYRIAAIDQLRKYADIIGSPLKAVGTAEETAAAVRSMEDCEFILIDTAGRSPNDALKLSELKALLAAAKPDEVHLVLSTTASEKCVELAISRFSEVRVDKIIFTKLDEASHVGVVLNVIHKLNKSLSYITTGQDVPDDIEVGQPRRLAQLILSGPAQ
ncbi:MAG: flagellar biosynthesis protein FlhF [Tepidisphaeraceae bacterium]